jgi:hypothetical protein
LVTPSSWPLGAAQQLGQLLSDTKHIGIAVTELSARLKDRERAAVLSDEAIDSRFDQLQVMMVTMDGTLRRLDPAVVDERLVTIEKQMAVVSEHSSQLIEHRTRIADIENRLDGWQNRAIGASGVVALATTVIGGFLLTYWPRIRDILVSAGVAGSGGSP